VDHDDSDFRIQTCHAGGPEGMGILVFVRADMEGDRLAQLGNFLDDRKG
jgi:hypothetical protein